VLAILALSITVNPFFDQDEIAADLADDPEPFSAEWLGEWRSGLAEMFDRELVEAVVNPSGKQNENE
jgi:hypothetical protein